MVRLSYAKKKGQRQQGILALDLLFVIFAIFIVAGILVYRIGELGFSKETLTLHLQKFYSPKPPFPPTLIPTVTTGYPTESVAHFPPLVTQGVCALDLKSKVCYEEISQKCNNTDISSDCFETLLFLEKVNCGGDSKTEYCEGYRELLDQIMTKSIPITPWSGITIPLPPKFDFNFTIPTIQTPTIPPIGPQKNVEYFNQNPPKAP